MKGVIRPLLGEMKLFHEHGMVLESEYHKESEYEMGLSLFRLL